MWRHYHIYGNEEINVEEEEGNHEENISKEEDAGDELYLERVVCDKEDEYESNEEDEEGCNAGESEEGSP
eukprot:12977798-Ditylum_brightwellii.AAC.1